MKTFKEAWAETGYQYGEDALENVELGWNMAIAMMAGAIGAENKKIIHERNEKKRMADIKRAYELAEEYEAQGRYADADRIRPCCPNEKRNMNGGCDSCGDPCF